MLFEAWGDEECATLLVEAGANRDCIDPGMVLLRSFKVDHWTEAFILHIRANGWGWWIPLREDREDYVRSLRRLGFTPKRVNDDRQLSGLPRLEWLDEIE